MKRYLLDTNIISNVVKPTPSQVLLDWLATRIDRSLHVSTLSVAEIRRGILMLPAGRKRQELEQWFAGPTGPQALFAGRVLAFDEPAALIWAQLMTDGSAAGRPRNPLDMMVAAIALSNGCIVVTDNERDFTGIPILNPLRSVP